MIDPDDFAKTHVLWLQNGVLDDLRFGYDPRQREYHAARGTYNLCHRSGWAAWTILDPYGKPKRLSPFCKRCLDIMDYWSISPRVWPWK